MKTIQPLFRSSLAILGVLAFVSFASAQSTSFRPNLPGQTPPRQTIVNPNSPNQNFPGQPQQRLIIPPQQNPIPSNRGMLVTGTLPGSPAHGILEYGDIIVRINGMPVYDHLSFQNAMASCGPNVNLLVRNVRNGALVPVNLRVWGFPRQLGVYAQPTRLPPILYSRSPF